LNRQHLHFVISCVPVPLGVQQWRRKRKKDREVDRPSSHYLASPESAVATGRGRTFIVFIFLR